MKNLDFKKLEEIVGIIADAVVADVEKEKTTVEGEETKDGKSNQN